MTLAQAFETYRGKLSLSAGQVQQVSDRRTRLISKLQAELHPQKILPIGSYARATNIPPVGDIDLMVVLPPVASGKPAPSEVLKQLQRLLQQHYKDVGVRPQKRSVGLIFEDFRFDLVPAFARAQGGYDIPDTSLEQWIYTNPEQHDALADQTDRKTGAMAVPLVRMMKAWKVAQGIGLKSFHLEVMVLRGLHSKPSSYAEGARIVFHHVSQAVRSSCGDPGESGHVLDEYLTEGQRQEWSRKCLEASQTMKRAIDLELAGRADEAVRLVKAVFGAPFPG